MSDRVAVFNHGRVEQVGAPADVYERPATAFVAGFVGTSNLLTGATAEKILGRGGVYSVRPEKIQLEILDGAPTSAAAGEISATGRIVEVVYAGPATRFVVDLDAGERLVVVEQNHKTSSADVVALRQRAVRLRWLPEHVISVPSSAS